MKIPTTKIPQDGLSLNFSIEKEALLDGLKEADELKEFVHNNLECNCHLTTLKDQIFINGEASLTLKPICFRCNKEFEKNYSADLNLTCMPDDRKKALRGEDYMDGDIGFNYYSDEELDMVKIVREQLFFTLPMTYLCAEDCKGLCPDCGVDLNHEKCKCGESLLKT